MYIEAKIYSWTDIFSHPRRQRSNHRSNCARSLKHQDMLALGYPKLLYHAGIENHVQKYIVKTMHNFPPKRKDCSFCPSIGLVYEHILWDAAVAKFG